MPDPVSASPEKFEKSNLASATFRGVTLTGADFNDVCLGHAKFENVSFLGVRIFDANMNGLDVSFTQLRGAYFHKVWAGPKEEFGPARFAECDLRGLRLEKCNLKDASLQGCDIAGMTIDDVPVADAIAAYRAAKAPTA